MPSPHLAHAGLAEHHGVVLGAPAQDVDHPAARKERRRRKRNLRQEAREESIAKAALCGLGEGQLQKRAEAHLLISSARPTSGSSCPARAAAVRSRPYRVSAVCTSGTISCNEHHAHTEPASRRPPHQRAHCRRNIGTALRCAVHCRAQDAQRRMAPPTCPTCPPHDTLLAWAPALLWLRAAGPLGTVCPWRTGSMTVGACPRPALTSSATSPWLYSTRLLRMACLTWSWLRPSAHWRISVNLQGGWGRDGWGGAQPALSTRSGP